MEIVLAYILKSSGILLLLIGAYWCFLRNDTFFQTNRWFLLLGIPLALLLPFVQFTKVKTVTLTYTEPQLYTTTTEVLTADNTGFNWFILLGILYALGVLYFSVRFTVQLVQIGKLKKNCQLSREDVFKLYTSKTPIAPFSFFKNIFYSPHAYSTEELKNIITHEKAHAKQNHSWDLMALQLCCMVFWFNPLLWIYKRMVQQNLEYAADAYAICQTENLKNYQYLMLKHSTGYTAGALTNPFFNSLIKNRIQMLHQKSSTKRSQLKVLLIMPLIAIFLMAFNVKTKTVYNYEQTPKTAINDTIQEVKIENITITIDKYSSDDVLQKDAKFLAEKGISLKYKGIKRNSNGEITSLKVTYDNGKGSKGVYQQANSANTIAPFKIVISFGSDNSANIVVLQEDNTQNEEVGYQQNRSIYNTDTNEKLIEIITTKGVEKIIVDGKEVSRDELSKIGKLEEKFINTIEVTESLDHDTEINEVKVEEANGDYKKITYLKQNSSPTNKIYLVSESKESQVSDKTMFNGLEQIGEHNDIRVRKQEINNGNDVIIIKETVTGETVDIMDAATSKQEGLHISNNGNTITLIGPEENNAQQEKEQPLYYIDGKKANKEEMAKLSPKNIESVNVIKGKKAIEKYGEKAKNGVIEIFTKKKN